MRLNIPISTITSLEAMMLSSEDNTIRVPMIDARRKYVFSAIYDENNNAILKPQHIKIEDLNEVLKNISNYIVITNDEIEEFISKKSYEPNIEMIVNFYQDKEEVNPHAVNPDYLKLTEAEESKIN